MNSEQKSMAEVPKADTMAWAFAENPPVDADPQEPSPELLLWAYGHAIFPMAEHKAGEGMGRIEWFSPDPRAILPLEADRFHVSKTLQRLVRSGRFEIRCDGSFEQVMRECSKPRGGDNVPWISEQIVQSYSALHRIGCAHSVEAWLDGQMVGGLYGVHIGGAFFGESMFSRVDGGGANSSKVCLVHLVNWLRGRGFALLDSQIWNPHMAQFGCVEIAAEEYERMLNAAIRLPVSWGEFRAT